MKIYRSCHQKCFLGLFNVVLMICGIIVLLAGFYLFTDQKRLMLSSLLIIQPDDSNPLKDLKHPLFFYVAFLLTIFGMLIFSISIIGYWTTLMDNYFLLATYFVMVLLLLLIKFAFSVVITIWPQCLGLNLNATEMVKILQGNYGVPDMEKYSNAMDFAQTYLDCCAINDSINYDTSLWRLQDFGKKELTVPLTCCKLMNKFEPRSYLDPMPINLTLCQSVELNDFQKSRHTEGCLDKIEYWYRENYIVLLCGGLVLAIVEFFVLLCIVLNCSKKRQRVLYKNKTSPVTIFTDDRAGSSHSNSMRRHATENLYHDDFLSITPEIREVFVQPRDLNKVAYSSAKYNGNNYKLSNRSYLI